MTSNEQTYKQEAPRCAYFDSVKQSIQPSNSLANNSCVMSDIFWNSMEIISPSMIMLLTNTDPEYTKKCSGFISWIQKVGRNLSYGVSANFLYDSKYILKMSLKSLISRLNQTSQTFSRLPHVSYLNYKFHQNPFIRFSIMLLPDKQTGRGEKSTFAVRRR